MIVNFVIGKKQKIDSRKISSENKIDPMIPIYIKFPKNIYFRNWKRNF